MKRALAVAAVVVSSPAAATIYAENDLTNINRINLEIRNEIVGPHIVNSLTTQVEIPEKKEPGEWHVIHLCHDGVAAWAAVTELGATPPCLFHRLVSAWGTVPRETSIMQQVQADRYVQFTADFDFDYDLGGRGLSSHEISPGSGLWMKRANFGGWPPGLTAAVYFRGEAGGSNGGLGQINWSRNCEEGTTRAGSMQMRAQAKGYSSAGNFDASHDAQRVVLGQDQNYVCVLINSESRAIMLNHGFELRF